MIHDTNLGRQYPGIFVYGAGPGTNLVEGNVIWHAGEGIQVVSDAVVRNNIIFDCLVTGNNPVMLEIYYGTAVGGTPSWGDMNGTYSGLQVDTAGTITGGVKIAQIFIGATATNKGEASKLFSARYPLALDVAGTGFNHITAFVTGIGGDSACPPGVTWEEVRAEKAMMGSLG